MIIIHDTLFSWQKIRYQGTSNDNKILFILSKNDFIFKKKTGEYFLFLIFISHICTKNKERNIYDKFNVLRLSS
jgi:hypothetical protein